MNSNDIPFVYLGKERRFIGSQVMKAIKKLQIKQAQNSIRGDISSVHNDTLSDVSNKLDKLNTNSNKDLKQLTKRSYKIRKSKSVKRNRA